ncbi:MAG: nucleotidyl transferase AbiEii/AbiGii toxin family protein [Coriobacteriia bacterium]|nr:nucleotidyl transferase AbiEii/AbiGii toxin family protein [Coriobacteriia bacterium]
MIPRAQITAWRASAPWPQDEQVEQDLVLSRALTAIFSRPSLREALAFRGGTALHKLHLDPPGRYSEDLDLVQVEAGPIGPVLAELREALDPWLGEPARKQGPASAKLLYRFETTMLPVRRMRVKVEINTREHFSVDGLQHVSFNVENPWHSAAGLVTTFTLEELLATKMRALFQRRKGRDLYDLWLGLTTLDPDEAHIIECLGEYLTRTETAISRAEFEANMVGKLASPDFRADVVPLLRDPAGYDVDVAALLVHDRLIARLPGEPWKGLT